MSWKKRFQTCLHILLLKPHVIFQIFKNKVNHKAIVYFFSLFTLLQKNNDMPKWSKATETISQFLLIFKCFIFLQIHRQFHLLSSIATIWIIFLWIYNVRIFRYNVCYYVINCCQWLHMWIKGEWKSSFYSSNQRCSSRYSDEFLIRMTNTVDDHLGTYINVIKIPVTKQIIPSNCYTTFMWIFLIAKTNRIVDVTSD